MGLETILRTKDAVQLILGLGRCHLVFSMATQSWGQCCPWGCSWGALGLWLPSWPLWWQPGCPRVDAGQGFPGKGTRSPSCGTTARADAEDGASTKRDSGSCKNGFSLSSCFADHHHCCCRMRQGPPQPRSPAVCGETESNEGEQRAWGTCMAWWLLSHKTAFKSEGPALQTCAEEPIPASASPWPVSSWNLWGLWPHQPCWGLFD